MEEKKSNRNIERREIEEDGDRNREIDRRRQREKKRERES